MVPVRPDQEGQIGGRHSKHWRGGGKHASGGKPSTRLQSALGAANTGTSHFGWEWREHYRRLWRKRNAGEEWSSRRTI